MASAALSNIVKALEAASTLPGYPTSTWISPFYKLENLEMIDKARADFYTDEASQRVFDWACQYRILIGAYGRYIPVDLEHTPFTAWKWLELERQAKLMGKKEHVPNDYMMDRIDTWLLEAYALKGLCEVKQNDIVLDCGAFTGNTSMYFSQKAGPEGHVFGFEPMPDVYAKYERNMARLSNVTPVNCAVSDVEGIVSFMDGGPGSSMCADSPLKAYAVSLDSFAAKHRLGRVNFIKLDVEGAEEKALLGAQHIIKTFKPMMAVSAYHKELDIVTLPALIRSIESSYAFALRHFSHCEYETVLYCYPN